MAKHLITREIGIDMGHRVTFHGSKCRNLHGHRYTIQATCEGPLAEAGEEQGMVLDFGFLKEEMMDEIDDPCDHGFCFWRQDVLMCRMFEPRMDDLNRWFERGSFDGSVDDFWAMIDSNLKRDGYCSDEGRGDVKIYVVPFVPTAENLARHWYARLAPRVMDRTGDRATLHSIKVWETPNCSAQYPT